MPLDLYLAFVASCIVLIVVPGPNVALIAANSVAHGVRYGLVTVAGTASAMVVQLTLVVFGASVLLASLATVFDRLRWLGVAYLLWLGVRAWCAASGDLAGIAAEPRSMRSIFTRGFLVSLTNPKTLLFYAAFLPQFVTADAGHATPQLVLLATTFIAVAILLDGVWAILASRLRVFLQAQTRLRNRITGCFMIGAGIGLALARK